MLRYTGSPNNDYCLGGARDSAAEYPTANPLQDNFHGDFSAPIRACPEQPIRPNPLVTKLETFVRLGSEEIEALEVLSRHPKSYKAEQILIHEGSTIGYVCLIVEGIACRYKLLPGGRRQIMAYLIPGDLCDVQFVVSNRADHSVSLVADSSVVKISTQKLIDVIARFPRIGLALSLTGLVENAILREWLLNIGQRDAMQKLSHFFCEMSERFRAIGRVDDDGSFELPINQATLADTIGLTSVHINRTLQRLRNAGLIRLCHRRLTILDTNRLAAVAEFDETYLRTRRPQD